MKPSPAVVVGQRNSACHALFVFGGMVLIPFDEIDVEGGGERLANDALAGSGHSHDYVEASVHDIGVCMREDGRDCLAGR